MNARYAHDLQSGLKYQDYVMELFHQQKAILLTYYSSIDNQVKKGECMQGIEVKLDRKFRETGNLFIETEERSSPTSEWHTAGISREDNSWAYAIGDETIVYVFGVKLLRQLSHTGEYRNKTVVNKTNTAKGFLLPVQEAEVWCLFKLNGELQTERRNSVDTVS